jgi:RNA polymerase sigma-70 factor (ECF subfamily)
MVVFAPKTSRKTVYEELPPLLFSIAYRMVGSASEAEDIVQEAFLRLHRETSQGTDIDSPKAWLSRGGLPASRPRGGLLGTVTPGPAVLSI